MAAGPGEFQRELVRSRAGHRCEYCRLPQEFSDLGFHIEHIVPRQHGGGNNPDNLALACPACNFPSAAEPQPKPQTSPVP